MSLTEQLFDNRYKKELQIGVIQFKTIYMDKPPIQL
jgi:hypothetical protein